MLPIAIGFQPVGEGDVKHDRFQEVQVQHCILVL